MSVLASPRSSVVKQISHLLTIEIVGEAIPLVLDAREMIRPRAPHLRLLASQLVIVKYYLQRFRQRPVDRIKRLQFHPPDTGS